MAPAHNFLILAPSSLETRMGSNQDNTKHYQSAAGLTFSNSAPAGFRFRRGPEGEAEERQWGAAIHRSPSDPDARVGVVHLRLGKGGAGGWGSEGRSSPAGPAIGGPPGPSGTVLTGGSVGEQGLIEVTDPILHEDLLKPQHESGRCTLRARRGVAPVSLRQEAGE